MNNRMCKKCNVPLNKKNCYPAYIKNRIYICKDCERERSKKVKLSIKLETLVAYGGKCVCCSESQIEFLCIDHIDGNGAEHRKSLNLGKIRNGKTVSGYHFYRWLKKNNFPKDNFQILCFNCNYAKHVYGTCPHNNS